MDVSGILGSTVVGTLVASAANLIIWKLNRNAAEADRNAEGDHEWRSEVDSKISALVESNRLIMLDRIKYLGQAYIIDGEVDFDDRRLLHAMHDTYHNKLGGNGDLDLIMEEVDKLPLKNKKG